MFSSPEPSDRWISAWWRHMLAGVKRALWRVPAVRSLYHLARAAGASRRFDPSRPEALPILVYQMAKVGSSTVTRTLDGIGLPREVHQLHYMMPEQLGPGRGRHLRAHGVLPYDWCLGRFLGARIRRVARGVEVPVVTLVRDPVARVVSGLFQVPWFADAELRGSDGELDPDRVLAHLERRFQAADVCDGAEAWFRSELAPMFDIDVFAQPFDRERGYAIYRSRQARVLVLRMEDLDQTLSPALEEFLRLPSRPKLVRANERSLTREGAVYAEVLERFRLPRETVERIYAGCLPRHFYPARTLARFVERWSR